ncbi:fungal-specific transcription factor domain-containing protein [Mycena alexandri]|uniref:Fungal-specific transcription factor domain-containing protein n=1 Tax=Mycena alexandri TaxID=1745969 RepID=A0AAD6S7K1_9AGAR|nr:fungal-specific transcription factor domain-containing protein [Mycena alexandri]
MPAMYARNARFGDGAEMLGSRCSHCINVGADCTYPDLVKTSVSAQGYVAALENRVEKMERLLEKLVPGIDFTEQLENEYEIEPLLQQHIETLPRNDDNVDLMLGKLKLNPENNRFFGKSSSVQFLQTALEFYKKTPGLPELPWPLLPQTHKRKEFWAPVQWVLPPPDKDTPQYKFPDDELLLTLVDLYFRRINTCWPVLHRPTFDQKVADKLHFRDRRFAATLLVVISLGARHSDDHRISLQGGELRSAGWEWYSQVSVVPKHLIYKPDLYELQVFALSAIYLQPLSLSPVVWNQIGLGLRRAQDVGAHRRRAGPPTVESEQWKRVFWVLLCLEWVFGTHIGRPLAMHTHDCDQDLPVNCDDECWDLPGPQKFQQPKNKPSEISYFISYAKLLEIQAAVATTIYSPRKPKDLSGNLFPPTEPQSIVAFDSALNSWLSNIPEHLRWDPARRNKIHLMQSALLHTTFYNVQILLHRPYIPAPFQVSPPGAVPSLAICTNAARACVRIFEAYKDRTSELELSFPMLPPVFTAAIVLVLSTWSGRKTGFANSPQQLEEVRFCIRLTTELEKRYPAAGRYTDIMNRLLYAGASLDSLFEMRASTMALPPSAQRGYEAKEASKQNFEHGDADLGALLKMNHVDVPPQSDSMFNLEQLLNFEPLQFPADGAVDADIMNMWSAAPSGFHMDDWSYIMSTDLELSPHFENLIPMLSDTPPQEMKETEKLHSEWNL